MNRMDRIRDWIEIGTVAPRIKYGVTLFLGNAAHIRSIRFS